MASSSFFRRATDIYHSHPRLLIALATVASTSGGTLAYTTYADARYNVNDGLPKKKVVILGTGWAGTSFVKSLKNSSYDVQVISPRNYFAFTPLLPSVTCGTVEARSIVEPIRNIAKKKNVRVEFEEAECYKIDPIKKKVYCRSAQNKLLEGKEEFTVDYDYLVVAMGARSNTFNLCYSDSLGSVGHDTVSERLILHHQKLEILRYGQQAFNTPGVEENCHFLKEIEDAQRIRTTVVDCFEKASLPHLTEEHRKQLLQFVIVGGGPTGVEFAAELHDFVTEDLAKLYPKLQPLVNITLVEAGDHILNMFDKRITDFAEKKFQRDGIDVRLGAMVTKVTDKEISTKDRASGNIKALPYGMVVWSTGIGTRPVVMEFMKQIGQTNRRVLATDEWLRVEGTNGIYALGDCATIQQRRVVEDIEEIIKKADKDNTGTLNVKELKTVIKDISDRYPQIEIYMKRKQFKDIVQLIKSVQGNDAKQETTQIDIATFKKALSEVDAQMKNLPATAQVAAQQGAYLADCFNRMMECEENPEGPLRTRKEGRHRFRPFRYKHFGQFAPLGGEQTAAQLPGDYVIYGHSTQWLWYSVYASKLVSWRTRMLVISDWMRRSIFGRDSSRL